MRGFRLSPIPVLVAAAWLVGQTGHAGTLAEIRERGTLRLLVASADDEAALPRAGWLPNEDRRLAEEFARELGVEPEWVYVEQYEGLIPALLEGRGDLVADVLAINVERSEQVAFTAPLLISRDQVVTRADDKRLTSRPRLAGRRMAVRPGTPQFERAESLRGRVPRMQIESVDVAADDRLAGVGEGTYDVTIADRDLVATHLAFRDDLRVAFDVGGDVPLGWAVAPDAPSLRQAADAFLLREHIDAPAEPFSGDLAAIRERGVLRVLTLNGPTTYYIWRGQLAGFEYELVRHFAESLDLQLEIVVPPLWTDAIRWLREGRGDLIAAGMPSDMELGPESVRTSVPYHEVRGLVIGPADARPLEGVEGLAGRRVAAHAGGRAWRALEEIRDRGVAVEIVPVPDDREVFEQIDDVASGKYDLVLVGSHMAATQLAWRDDVKVVLDLGETVDLAWATRLGNPELGAAVDAFLEGNPGLRRTLARKYFGNQRRMRHHGRARSAPNGALSPYDAAVRRFSSLYAFDWRLITSQMAQESGFDPQATSYVGAFGLMQLMPDTAAQMAIAGWREPEGNIHAGVKYMNWVRARYPADIDAGERVWLSLASYNAGVGHVADARRLAEQQGLDPNRWFGHVEKGMLLKCDPEFYRKTRYGYCRCHEPVGYVRAIRERYRAYLKQVALEAGPPGPGAGR